MFGNLDEDVTAFAEHYGGTVEFKRLAVLPEHIDEYRLPTAPPKATDKRVFCDDRTVQAEAFDPATLANIVTAAIKEHMDIETLSRLKVIEADDRRHIVERLGQLRGLDQ